VCNLLRGIGCEHGERSRHTRSRADPYRDVTTSLGAVNKQATSLSSMPAQPLSTRQIPMVTGGATSS
jgi:hypothetical protein